MCACLSPSHDGSYSEGNARLGSARQRKSVQLPIAEYSQMLLIRSAPGDTGLFRYLLEGAGGHLAMLTVLDPKKALFKLLFSSHQREELLALLESMKHAVQFEVFDYPFSLRKNAESSAGGEGRT